MDSKKHNEFFVSFWHINQYIKVKTKVTLPDIASVEELYGMCGLHKSEGIGHEVIDWLIGYLQNHQQCCNYFFQK